MLIKSKSIILILILSIHIEANDRVVALSPAINEIIYALDRGDKIVANTEYCNYPLASKDKYKVGGYFSVSLERVLKSKPSLVIMQENNRKLSTRLERFKIKTEVVKINRLEDISNTIKIIGKLLGNNIKANSIIKNINQKLKETQNIIKDKKILIVIGEYKNILKGIFVVGENLYLNDIIITSGNQNAFKSSRIGQPVLNLENILATKADIVIILAPYLYKNKMTKDDILEPWQNISLPASKNKNIFIIDKDYAGVSSDRLVFFLEDFKKILKQATFYSH